MRNKDILNILSLNDKKIKQIDRFKADNYYYTGGDFEWEEGALDTYNQLVEDYNNWLEDDIWIS